MYVFKYVLLLMQNVEVEEEHGDERSVDDLLSFINGGNGGVCVDIVSTPYFLVISGFIFIIWYNAHSKLGNFCILIDKMMLRGSRGILRKCE